MKALKVFGVVIVVLVIAVLATYSTMVMQNPVGQPRLLRLGSTRVLMETVPANETGYWFLPVYAETFRNGALTRVVAGHSVRIGRINFYAVRGR